MAAGWPRPRSPVVGGVWEWTLGGVCVRGSLGDGVQVPAEQLRLISPLERLHLGNEEIVRSKAILC